jgi:hypothetical protein
MLASAAAFNPTLNTTPTQRRARGGDINGSTALSMSGVTRNPNFAKLAGGYLFPEIGRRRTAYIAENPDMADRIISLGIGDTTQPIPEHILGGLVSSAAKLGTKEGYSGYGAEQGMAVLRAKIADKLYGGIIKDSEVFVSDGAKCDIMRIQQVFGPGVTTAVQVSLFISTLLRFENAMLPRFSFCIVISTMITNFVLRYAFFSIGSFLPCLRRELLITNCSLCNFPYQR